MKKFFEEAVIEVRNFAVEDIMSYDDGPISCGAANDETIIG